MTSKIVDYDRPWRFVDQMQRGPFAAWWHEHRFERHPAGTRMVDVAEYRLPLGPLGGLVDLLFLRRYLRRLLQTRHHHIKLAAEHPGVGGDQLR